MRQAKLLGVTKYTDTSYKNKIDSSTIHWMTPSGRYKEKHFYGTVFTEYGAKQWLEGKYRPRLTNLFGLIYYIW